MALYEVAVLGDPTEPQLKLLEDGLREAAAVFQLEYGVDITLEYVPVRFEPSPRSAALVVFFGGSDTVELDVSQHVDLEKVPVLPVASRDKRVAQEIPESIRSLNCLFFDQASAQLVPSVLASLGLIPRLRRVFLSYKRSAATPAAIQLFSEISARRFDVFLDTHCVDVAEVFQDELWHQLCDSDVLITLQTPDYFDSRWTTAEWGRALSKGIGVLSVDWPDSTPSIHTGTASRVELIVDEISSDGTLSASAIERICSSLERVRVTSHAARHMSLVSSISDAVIRIGGRVNYVGADRTVEVELRTGRRIAIQPRVGVPTSVTAQEALDRAKGKSAAVVYDHIGIKDSWQKHLGWLGDNVPSAKWIRASEAGWVLAGWEA